MNIKKIIGISLLVIFALSIVGQSVLADKEASLKVSESFIEKSEGETVEFNVLAKGGDVSIENKPADAKFYQYSQEEWIFVWNTDYKDSGNYMLDIKVTRNKIILSKSVAIVVKNVNQKPTLSIDKDHYFTEGELKTIKFKVNDPDGDDVKVYWGDYPYGSEMTKVDSKNYVISWKPGFNDFGDYNPRIIINDNAGSGDITYTTNFHVGNVNLFPLIEVPYTSKNVEVGQLVSFDVKVTDFDSNKKPVVTVDGDLKDKFNLTTSKFAWTPKQEEIGKTLTLKISAKDDSNYTVTKEIKFTVKKSSVDTDGDSVSDLLDNCPAVVNKDQLDTDGDKKGDACDTDKDGDSVLNTKDNCPLNANSKQEDMDNDGTGDVCDSDKDGDKIENTKDNCPTVVNNDQKDTDGDKIGDACEGTNPEKKDPVVPKTADEKKYDDLKKDFDDLEDKFEKYEDKYKDAISDKDKDDQDKYEKKLDDVDDDLKKLEDKVEDFESDMKKAKKTTLEKNAEDLLDEIDEIRDDIKDLLNKKTSSPTGALSQTGFTPSVGKKTNTPTSQPKVEIQPLQVPQESVPAESGWEKVRFMTWIIAGIIIVLAVVIFLIALLLR